MAEDKKISEAVELLLKGAKMLSYHCPDCMLPVFQQDERIFCPHCMKDFRIVEEKNVRKIVPVDGDDGALHQDLKGPQTREVGGVEGLVLELLEKLGRKALSSDSVPEIREIVNTMKELAEIYRMIRERDNSHSVQRSAGKR